MKAGRLSKALPELAVHFATRGKMNQARHIYTDAIEQLTASGHFLHNPQSSSCRETSYIAAIRGDFDSARDEIYKLEEHRMRGNMLSNIGDFAALKGDFDIAGSFYEDALQWAGERVKPHLNRKLDMVRKATLDRTA